MRTSYWLFYLAVLLLLAVVFSHPLLHYMNGGMPYSAMPTEGRAIVHQFPGDYLQLFYRFWLFNQAAAGRIHFLSNPYEFSTPGTPPLFTTQGIPISLIFLLFSYWGNIFAYNALVILSFIAAGMSLTLLLMELKASRGAAILCGVLYACLPYRLGHLFGGHPGGFVFFLTPLSIFCFERAWKISETGRLSILWGILSGLCFFSAALTDLHTAFFIAIFLAAYILFKLIDLTAARGFAKAYRTARYPILGMAITGTVALLYLLWVKYFFLETSIAKGGRTMEMVQAFSPQIRNVLGKNPNAERNIYLGLIPFLLAVYGALARRLDIKKKRTEPGALLWLYFWVGSFLLTYSVALGTALDRYIPLYSWIHDHLPFLAYSRTPSRAMAIAAISLFVLAGYGLRKLLPRGVMAKIIVFTAIPLALLDYHPRKPIGISLLMGKDSVYAEIQKLGGKGRLLELPIWPGDSAWSAIYEYYISLTGVPIINGYNPVPQLEYVKQAFIPLRNLNLGEMRQEQYELLKGWNSPFIVLHQEAFPRKVSRYPFRLSLVKLLQSPYLEFVRQDGPHFLFRLKQKPGRHRQDLALSSPIGNLYPASKMKSDIGNLVNDAKAASGQSICASRNSGNGWLWYGHSRIYPTGDFRVSFNLKTDSTAGRKPLARIEVYAPETNRVIATRELTQRGFAKAYSYELFSLPFTNRAPTRVEFRLFHLGAEPLWADFAYVLFERANDPRHSYEAEDLFHIGSCVSDRDASDGLAVQIKKNEDIYIPMVNGPDRIYGPGKYRVLYRMKATEAESGVVAKIQVVSSFGGIIASHDIHEREFLDSGEYRDCVATFELKKKTPLSFQLWHSNKALLWLDRIDVEELGKS